MHYIGVISDTHGLLRKEVEKELRHCDIILHGGDISKERTLIELGEIAPVYAVRGNADKEEWAENLPEILEKEFFGIRVRMIHNRKGLPEDSGASDLVVFGHSHKYVDREENGVRFLNPGSCGPRRFHQPVTMAVVEVSGTVEYKIKRIDIPQTPLHESVKIPEKDMYRIVEDAIKRVDKGQSAEKIAENLGIDQELAEQICRMYLTHPGVDVDGILNRVYHKQT